jgi:hypothetical protein
MLNELISIANELDKRGLAKEADELDGLINKTSSLNKSALSGVEPVVAPAAGSGMGAALAAIGLPLWGAAAIGLAVVGGGLWIWKMTEDEETVWNSLTPPVTDFGSEEAGQLYARWRAALAKEDLIDGPGTFPVGNSMGGTWIKEQFDTRFENMKTIDAETEFEPTLKAAYGQDIWFGLDNEDGWVDSFNKIITKYKLQTELTDMGLDWRTEMALGEKSGNAWEDTAAQQATEPTPEKEKTVEKAVEVEPERDREPSTLDEAAETDESWESSLDSNQSIWKEVMGAGT